MFVEILFCSVNFVTYTPNAIYAVVWFSFQCWVLVIKQCLNYLTYRLFLFGIIIFIDLDSNCIHLKHCISILLFFFCLSPRLFDFYSSCYVSHLIVCVCVCLHVFFSIFWLSSTLKKYNLVIKYIDRIQVIFEVVNDLKKQISLFLPFKLMLNKMLNFEFLILLIGYCMIVDFLCILFVLKYVSHIYVCVLVCMCKKAIVTNFDRENYFKEKWDLKCCQCHFKLSSIQKPLDCSQRISIHPQTNSNYKNDWPIAKKCCCGTFSSVKWLKCSYTSIIASIPIVAENANMKRWTR